jgi:hypothetical protein
LSKEGAKEAVLLGNRIVLCECASMLASGALRSLPPRELAFSLKKLADSDVSLPFTIRLQLSELRVENLMEDLVDCAAEKEKNDEMASLVATALSPNFLEGVSFDCHKPTFSALVTDFADQAQSRGLIGGAGDDEDDEEEQASKIQSAWQAAVACCFCLNVVYHCVLVVLVT